MDCNCKSNKEKHSYHFNISEVVDDTVSLSVSKKGY